MGLLDKITDLIHGDQGLDQPPPKPKDGKKPSSVLTPPPTRMRLSKEAWWVRVPEARSMSVHLNAQESELARTMTRQIHLGKLDCPAPPDSMLRLFALVGSKTQQYDELASLLTDADWVSAETLQFVCKRSSVKAGKNGPLQVDAWRKIVRGVQWDDVLRALVTDAFVALVERGSQAVPEETTQLLEHGQAAALAARHLAAVYRFGRPLLAYVGALFHDLGRAVVYWKLAEDEALSPAACRRLLRHLDHSLHEEAGAAVARAWRFPETVVQVIGGHHLPPEKDDRLAGLRALVHLADLCALRCGHGEEAEPHARALLETEPAQFLKLNKDNAERVLGPIPNLMITATL